jgi:APA family basic amino acid/polyamine antiporter
MAASLPTATWWRLVLWSAVGIAVYLLYGYRNSRLRTPEIPGGAATVAPAAD